MPPKSKSNQAANLSFNNQFSAGLLGVLSVLTNKRGMIEQAMQGGLVVRFVQECLNGIADFRVEHAPDPHSMAIMLPTQPMQKAIKRFGFRLKPFESIPINPSQVSVLHPF